MFMMMSRHPIPVPVRPRLSYQRQMQSQRFHGVWGSTGGLTVAGAVRAPRPEGTSGGALQVQSSHLPQHLPLCTGSASVAGALTAQAL
mmetsp:Transcript_16021/g.26871  ORF Transcript_16021/g.26871 Transcript_16021/m.26871 type:complete len:88 (-) Transcript_16021:170-433(-)